MTYHRKHDVVPCHLHEQHCLIARETTRFQRNQIWYTCVLLGVTCVTSAGIDHTTYDASPDRHTMYESLADLAQKQELYRPESFDSEPILLIDQFG